MVRSDYHRMRSTAVISGHPIHPMPVVFPIGIPVGTLTTDLTFWRTRDPFWARTSKWLLGAGIVMGTLAAVAGLRPAAGAPTTGIDLSPAGGRPV